MPIVVLEGWMGDRNVRLVMASMVVVFSLGIVTFVILRLQAVDMLQSENMRLKAELSEMRGRLEAEARANTRRVELLEQMVYGTLEPISNEPQAKPRIVLSAPAQWQLNRDRELRARLSALEQWRMRTDKMQ